MTNGVRLSCVLHLNVMNEFDQRFPFRHRHREYHSSSAEEILKAKRTKPTIATGMLGKKCRNIQLFPRLQHMLETVLLLVHLPHTHTHTHMKTTIRIIGNSNPIISIVSIHSRSMTSNRYTNEGSLLNSSEFD